MMQCPVEVQSFRGKKCYSYIKTNTDVLAQNAKFIHRKGYDKQKLIHVLSLIIQGPWVERVGMHWIQCALRRPLAP